MSRSPATPHGSTYFPALRAAGHRQAAPLGSTTWLRSSTGERTATLLLAAVEAIRSHLVVEVRS